MNTVIDKDGNVTLIQGDDVALVWTIPNYAGPSVAGSTVEAGLMSLENYNANVSASAFATAIGSASLADGTLTISVSLSSAVTASLESSPLDDVCNWIMQVVILFADHTRGTMLMPAVTVLRRII